MRFYIKEARENAGLSQKELAERLGVAPSTYHGYESGNHDPKSDMLIRIAGICGVSVDFLLGVETEPKPKKEKAPNNNLSLEALQMAKLFDTLDNYGQDAVREVAQVEKARCEDEERFLRETELEQEPRVIPDYTFGAAAGPLLGVAGQESVPYTLQPEDPPGAVYAVHVNGDSMEPYFPDGARVFVNMDQVRDGDIGIFCVDGATVIKQYHYDPFLGITYLFSLNRKRSDMDVVLTRNDPRSLVCQGRVITKRHFPLPV